MQNDPWKGMLIMLLLSLAIRQTVIKNLTCWSCGFECCFLRFEFNGSMCLWMVGTSWRQQTCLNPNPEVWLDEILASLFCSVSGWWIVVFNSTFSHHLCLTPLPVIIVLDIRYPQLGRCLGGEIHLIFWALRIVVFFNLPRPRSRVVWRILATSKCDLRNSTNQSWFDLRNRTWHLKGLTFKRLLQWELLIILDAQFLRVFLFVFVSLCNICSKDVQERGVNWTYLFDLLPPASAIAGWKMDHECMNLTPPLTLVFFPSWWAVPYQW